MKRMYYVTWTEIRNKVVTDYILCNVPANNAKELRERLVAEEQMYRKDHKKPFMFYLRVSASRPCDAARRVRGHLYF